jgi:hypothetical protein
MINNFNPGFDREKAAFIELANRGAGLAPINYLYAKKASFESILSPIITGGTAELYTIYGKGIYSVNIVNSEDIITSRLKWSNPFNNYYAGFIAGNLTQNTIWRLPLQDGNDGEVLSTNGSGSLSFINVTTGAAPIDAKYILQIPNEQLPNAQALSKLSNGLMKNNGGVIQIAVANKDYLTPSLAYGKLWISNSSNVASQAQTISTDNLPNLNYGKLWLGNINNMPEASSTINSSNLPDLSEGKVWQGDFSNRPIEVDIKLSPTDATYIIQTPNPNLTEAQVLTEVGIGMTKLLEGGVFAIAVPGEDYVTTEELEEIEEQCKEYASEAQGSADAAASSAEEAATSAEEAASSATEASASATEATTAAGEASAAAGEATASAGAASTAALAAAASATAAGYYADDASDYADDASDYADDAYDYSEDASDSADDAGNHADSASKSASKASDSAGDAAKSADDAKDYLDKLLNTGLNELPCSGDVSLNNYKLINVAIPTLANDGATKGYVDSAIGNIPGGDIILQGDIKGAGPLSAPVTTILMKTLNQITNAGDIDIGNFLITNLKDPGNPNDASTRNYVDNKTWITAQITDFKTEVAAFSLDQFAKPVAGLDLNMQTIMNLSTPFNPNDATTKSYVDTAIDNIPEADLILQGDIKGAGPLSAPVTTILMKTLNQIENAGDINIGNFFMENVKDPVKPTQAATKNYVDSVVTQAGANIILEGFVLGGPAIEGILTTTRGPACLLCNIPAGGDVSMDDFAIRNLADMPPQLDEASEKNAINFEFLFKLLNDEII